MAFESGHALVIGVGQYQFMSEYNVPIAGKDAEAVGAVLQNPDFCCYPPAQVNTLTKNKTTRANILTTLDQLAVDLQEKDTLFLFFVGHGVYGTDGNYYLTTNDTKLEGKRVVAKTGISETDLIDKLRKIRAKRILLVINACHAGSVKANFALGDTLSSETPPANLTEALLSTGEGRITITACRPEQKSWIGDGSLSIFSNALVEGLKGAAGNGKGYVSAFGLYEYLYQESKDAAEEQLGQTQEPELTIIKGVGPFPVALVRGASNPETFDVSAAPPAGTAIRQISPEKSQRRYQQYQATLNGDGAIAQGDGAKAVGKGGILVEGNVSGNIVVGNGNRINDK